MEMEERFSALDQARSKHRMVQVCVRFGETAERIVRGRGAGAQASELREDEPHPVRPFAPLTNLAEGGRVIALLGADEAIEIETFADGAF